LTINFIAYSLTHRSRTICIQSLKAFEKALSNPKRNQSFTPYSKTMALLK